MRSLTFTVVLPLLAATAGGQALQAPSPLNIQINGGQIHLSWQSEYLRPYQIEAGSDLVTWAEIGPMRVGTGGIISAPPHTNSAPRYFYRLREGAMRPGFDEVEYGRNDDMTYPQTEEDSHLSPVATPIGFGVRFFENTYTHCYVNNNGNITFNNPLAIYTPYDLGAQDKVMIAAFWADVDTRNAASGLTRFSQYPGVANGRPAFGVTWRGVGFFRERIEPDNSFQLLLIDRADIAPGDFDIEFNYNQIQWETGEASGGDSHGLGGSPARVGWANGTGRFMEYKGSGQTLAFLDKKPGESLPNYADGLKYQMWNSSIPGRIVIPVRGGIPSSEPGLEFQANAGPDQTLALGAAREVTLAGSITPSEVTGVSHVWTQVAPTFPLAEIASPGSLVTAVILPEPAEFKFRLTATKQGTFISSSSDEVVVTHPDNISVSAGYYYYFEENQSNTFDLDQAFATYNGSNMTDVEWEQIDGEPCDITNPNAIVPTIVFPGPGDYLFRITGRSGGLPQWEQTSDAFVTIAEPSSEP